MRRQAIAALEEVLELRGHGKRSRKQPRGPSTAEGQEGDQGEEAKEDKEEVQEEDDDNIEDEGQRAEEGEELVADTRIPFRRGSHGFGPMERDNTAGSNLTKAPAVVPGPRTYTLPSAIQPLIPFGASARALLSEGLATHPSAALPPQPVVKRAYKRLYIDILHTPKYLPTKSDIELILNYMKLGRGQPDHPTVYPIGTDGEKHNRHKTWEPNYHDMGYWYALAYPIRPPNETSAERDKATNMLSPGLGMLLFVPTFWKMSAVSCEMMREQIHTLPLEIQELMDEKRGGVFGKLVEIWLKVKECPQDPGEYVELLTEMEKGFRMIWEEREKESKKGSAHEQGEGRM